MNSHYGLEADGRNLLYFFHPHGSKNWADIGPGYISKSEFPRIQAKLRSKGDIIFHDQEPFDSKILDTYRWYLIKEKNQAWRKTQSFEEIMLSTIKMHLGWQIFCHSEYDSEDIRFADQAGSITCHYFYHGLIARDWFRHWKHHGGFRFEKNPHYRFLLYARSTTGSRSYRSNLLQDLQPFRSIISHDWDRCQTVSPEYSSTISVSDAQTSAIHLVAETIFDQNKIHLTEKIFKPMVMLQPFIVFSGAGSLQYLKRYGFRTFDSVWDESYDQEKDNDARYRKILNLINQLASLTDSEINDLVLKCRPILEHNHRLFFSEKFEQQMLDELRSNMSQSLEQQADRTKQYPGGAMFYQFELLRQRGEALPAYLIDDLRNIMQELSHSEPERYQAILHQYSSLLNNLV